VTASRPVRAPLRVLGVDPGLTRCGVGVVEGPPARPVLVAATCIRTSVDDDIAGRLLAVHDGIAEAIETHRPDVVAVERVLFSVNVRTAMATGQAAGVALLAAARAGLPVTPYSPTEVKASVAGYGAADKVALARMVAAQLRLDAPPTPADVADALAVALTHLGRARLAAAAQQTPAATALAEAVTAAGARARGGWAGVLDNPNVRQVGGA
jgi:crossover junction endodeoxyribonuclease RuvC